MDAVEAPTMQQTDIKTPVRNRYFYGKLLDVYHFELETNYFNAKRWLLNRLVSGYGVICGLNVEPGAGANEVIITPGVAIDKCGREIIVPERTRPLTIPSELLPKAEAEDQKQARQEREEEDFVHVVLCYHECESDPTPVLTSDCHTKEVCVSGTIRERYRVEFREGCATAITTECRLPDVITGGRIDYEELAKWISGRCREVPEDCCIPLANIRVEAEAHPCHPEDIDITVRPIVYTNDLLFDLLLCLLTEAPKYRGGKT